MTKKDLIEGFERFRSKNYESGERLMEKLVKEGAHPDFFIINCIDPRNGADLVFDARPGQQFIHSQMGAIVPPHDSPDAQPELVASLSYAIDTKKIKHLIVMGHSECGAAGALAHGTTDSLIAAWVKVAEDARKTALAKVGEKNKDALQYETERQVVMMSLQNLLKYPTVKKAVAEGRLTVSGWFFDMKQGALHEYDTASHAFKQLAGQQPPARVVPLPKRKCG